MNTITIELPLEIDKQEAKLMIFASLFGKGIMSSGKAAEHLKMKRIEFLEKVGDYGISFFADDENSLQRAMKIML